MIKLKFEFKSLMYELSTKVSITIAFYNREIGWYAARERCKTTPRQDDILSSPSGSCI